MATEKALSGWVPPFGGDDHETAFPLHVYNSLTRTKVPFVPIKGRRVLWYMCGPTVYDVSHMGHARTYICFDVLRRIMTHVFNYDVSLTMNITDIDDKIIKRSAEAGVPFLELARRFETEFLADMASLGVAPPDAMTRVSEYVPEIIDIIARIMEHGYAYESNGSVYFDTVAYTASGKHTYGKLVPEFIGNAEALAEGEGVLASASLGAADKRASSDFALWKRSRPGEPAWASPWGEGRPGWHIECTAMCGDVLGRIAGGPIDIHTGGIDLRFPHHDNEIAQSEALFECKQWVNYFLHSGHLHIDGLKMSKSLKNFVSIRAALEANGPRRLRIACLLQRYNAPATFSESGMEGAAAVERTFDEFFGNARARLRGLPRDAPAKWGPREHAFGEVLRNTRATVRARLADDFDTPGALAALSDLVRETNKYMKGDSSPPLAHPLQAAAEYVTLMFRVFGLVDPLPAIGYTSGPSADDAGATPASREAALAPLLDALAAFRLRVRDAARRGDSSAVLSACDELRDVSLPPLGVVLEDAGAVGVPGGSGGSRWKLRDPAELRREAEARERDAADMAARKAEAAAAAAARAAEKAARARIPPAAMFASQIPERYSVLDADGVPTHGADGVALAPSAIKKLRKEWAAQKKLHETWLARKDAGGAAPDGEDGGAAEVDGDAAT